MGVGFVSLLIKLVVKCAIEVSNNQFVLALSFFNDFVCIFPKLRCVFGGGINC